MAGLDCKILLAELHKGFAGRKEPVGHRDSELDQGKDCAVPDSLEEAAGSLDKAGFGCCEFGSVKEASASD